MSKTFNYGSVLAEHIRRYVGMREAMGYKIIRSKCILKEFDNYADAVGLKEPRITRELVDGWRRTRINDSEVTIYVKYTVWKRLAIFMNHCGAWCYVPQPPRPPKSAFTPYIFTHEQITAIFSEADKIVSVTGNMKEALFPLPALFRLLYSTGMRIGEAISLKNGDVRLKDHYILLRNTKNGMERMIPVCESLENVLRQYESYRDIMPVPHVAEPDRPYFIKPDGSGLHNVSVSGWFRKMYMRCGIPFVGDHRGPRIHDLRHTMACHALERMSGAGMDMYATLPVLSCMLGHKSVDATERYVRLTRDMYPGIAERCSGISAFVLPKHNTGEDLP